MRTLISFSLVVAATFAAGCGDIGSKSSTNSSTGEGISFVNNGVKPGPGPGTSNFSFGVDPSTSMADLSPAEIDAGCDRFESYFMDRYGADKLDSFACTAFGYFAATDTADAPSARQACVASRDECLRNPEELEFGCPLEDADGCDVSMAAVERCTNLQIDYIGGFVESLTCDEATPEGGALEDFERNFPECMEVESACGDVIIEETEPVPPGG